MRAARVIAGIVGVALVAGCAGRLTAPSPSIKAELTPRRELRAAFFTGNPVIASKNRETGELSGTAFMLGRALAADAGVGFAPIEYTTIARLMDDAKTGAWDVAVLAIDPARRAVIDYAPPYVVVDITYLVRPGSPIASVAEADRPGVRVTAARGAATALMLQRTLKNAQLTPADSEPAAFELIREGKADAYAQNRFMLLGLADRLPGARVLDDFMATARAAPDHVFLGAPPAAGRAYHPDGIELTYAQTRDAVLTLRDRYTGAGYGHGHRVALLLENRPEFFFHYLALNALGCSIVPINPDYRHDEMLYQMEHSEADLAVVVAARVAALEAIGRERPTPLPVIDAERMPKTLPKPPPAPRRGAPGLDTETSLLYTSGTTGRPKGCILTNFYYLNAGAWYRDFGGRLAIEPGRERFLNPLPLFHMNAQAVTATCAILTANCLAQPERFSPSRWWKDVVAAKATIIHYLGVMPPLLLNRPETPEERAHHVKFGFGAGVEPELHARFEERFGFPLVEVWGMTETGRCYADLHEPRQITTRAFGRPFGGLEGRVVDDADRDVPRGSAGGLLVRRGGAAGPRPRL